MLRILSQNNYWEGNAINLLPGAKGIVCVTCYQTAQGIARINDMDSQK